MVTKTSLSSWYAYRDRKVWTNLVGEPSAYTREQTASESLSNSVSYGVDYPDWRDRIRDHNQATTLLSGFERRNSNSNDGYAFLKFRNSSGTFVYREMLGSLVDLTKASVSDPSSFTVTSALNSAIQDLNSEIRSAQRSLQGLVSLGEMGETVRMVNNLGRDIFGRSHNYLRDLSQVAKYLTPQNLLRTVSERWLEYRFGIRPLLSDISGFVDACYQARYGRQPVVPIRSRARAVDKTPGTRSISTMGQGFQVTTVLEKELKYSCKLYGAIGLTSDNTVPDFSDEFGLTLDEFAPTLWELIPFSFLADYALNLGAIIDGYSLNKSGVKWVALGEERLAVTKLTGEIKILPVISDDSSNEILDTIIRPSTPLTRTRRYISRAPYNHSLIPSLEFRIPGCSTQWLNIGALSALHADTSFRLRQRLRL